MTQAKLPETSNELDAKCSLPKLLELTVREGHSESGAADPRLAARDANTLPIP